MMWSMITRLRRVILMRSDIDFFFLLCYNSGVGEVWGFLRQIGICKGDIND